MIIFIYRLHGRCIQRSSSAGHSESRDGAEQKLVGNRGGEEEERGAGRGRSGTKRMKRAEGESAKQIAVVKNSTNTFVRSVVTNTHYAIRGSPEYEHRLIKVCHRGRRGRGKMSWEIERSRGRES